MKNKHPSRPSLSRRDFFKTGALTSLVLGSGAYAQSARAAEQVSEGSAKNIIFLVSDGMSIGTLSMADQYLLWKEGKRSQWMQLYLDQRGRRGLMDVASHNSIVTDSAAASVAWGCGHRVNNGSVNLAPDGTHHTPILPLARASGKATGLVTTARVTHATPAGFAANVPNRGQEPRIAAQYLEREIDIILGGGREHFDPDRRNDGRDLAGDFAEKRYAVVRTSEELKNTPLRQRKILGLFSNGHLPYELDRVNDDSLKQEVPSLAELTTRALRSLSRNEKGFVLQVEGARVDHAAHANDIGGLIFDQIAFDEAIGVALAFQAANPETLVIITTDHGNANPGLNSGNNKGERNFGHLSGFKGTHGALGLNAGHTANEIVDRFKEVTGLEISADDAELLRRRLNDDYRAPYRRMNGHSAVIGQVIANHTDIGWVGNSHTSDYVELLALGPGSEGVKPYTMNTDLFHLMVKAGGIET